MEQLVSLDYKEKTDKINSLILNYRVSNDMKFKNQVFELVQSDLRKFFASYFYRFPYWKDDILQELNLVILTLINEGSPFDPQKGINLIYYAKPALLSQGRAFIDRMKTSIKYEPKKRLALMKVLNEIKQENPNFDDNQAIEVYVKREYKILTDDKIAQKIAEKKCLLAAGESSPSLDEPIDEDGNTIGSNIPQEESDFSNKVEVRYQTQLVIAISKKMYKAGKLSDLQFEAFKAFTLATLRGEKVSNAELAKRMNKSRQNFDRALNEALRRINEFCKKHFPEDF